MYGPLLGYGVPQEINGKGWTLTRSRSARYISSGSTVYCVKSRDHF